MIETSSHGTSYQLHGPENHPVVALVHGLGLSQETWNGHAPELAKNYRVLTYDLFGHSDSIAPPTLPSVTLFSDQLRDLMDELNIYKAAIVGFSLGGMINRRFAMDYPDRASALVVLNSPHDRGEKAQKLVEQQAADSDAGGVGATLDAAIMRWFTQAFRENHPGVIQKVRDRLMANDPHIYAQCRSVLAHGVKELIRPDPPISHPTLVMTCEHDSGSTPKMSYDIAAEIEGAETMIVSDLQHMGLVERPELFTTPILEFLNKHL